MSLRQGVALGLEEVAWNARLLQMPLSITRTGQEAPPTTAIRIVVANRDDEREAGEGISIYTCPLKSWRPDAWSVASPESAWTGDQRTDWHHTLATPGAAALNARFLRQTGMPMDAEAWRGWMAVKVAFELAVRGIETDPLELRFDGHKGSPLYFSEDGHLVQPTVRMAFGRAELVEAVDADLLSELH